jgi:signal transduction histidine kinase
LEQLVVALETVTRFRHILHLVLVPGLILAALVGYDPSAPGAPYVTALGLAAIVFFSSYSLCRRVDAARKETCELDEQLIQSQKLAALGELSSGIAHEINTPLAIISQESEWMRHVLKSLAPAPDVESEERNQSFAEIGDSLDQIIVQVNRCREVTHGMLNLARKHVAVEQETDVNRLVDDMANWIEKEAVRQNVVIHRAFDPDLPFVQTDSPLLRQVVLNLLNNAFQAIGHDGEIGVSTRRADKGHIAIEVRDTGCGIPKEHLDKIFNPFFTTKDPGKGAGLGLSISLSIVDKLGGKITATSEPGEFTSFVVTLPLQRNSA